MKKSVGNNFLSFLANYALISALAVTLSACGKKKEEKQTTTTNNTNAVTKEEPKKDEPEEEVDEPEEIHHQADIILIRDLRAQLDGLNILLQRNEKDKIRIIGERDATLADLNLHRNDPDYINLKQAHQRNLALLEKQLNANTEELNELRNEKKRLSKELQDCADNASNTSAPSNEEKSDA
ncbi:MAG: hypothetical protein KBD63_06895, partial [Bacteriovoracaceae bacterium]|nr:hypothetical protein [Bacteriovoracaceae bacterium]